MALWDASGAGLRLLLAGTAPAGAATPLAAAARLPRWGGAAGCAPLPVGISALALHAAGVQLRGLHTCGQGSSRPGSGLLAPPYTARGLAPPPPWGVGIGGACGHPLHAAPLAVRRRRSIAAAATAAGRESGSWGGGGAHGWEAQWRGFAAGGAPKDEPAPGAPKVLPDAQECDEAIEKYREVRRARVVTGGPPGGCNGLGVAGDAALLERAVWPTRVGRGAAPLPNARMLGWPGTMLGGTACASGPPLGAHVAAPASELPHGGTAHQGHPGGDCQRHHRHGTLSAQRARAPVGAAAQDTRAVGRGLGEPQEDGQARGAPLLGGCRAKQGWGEQAPLRK